MKVRRFGVFRLFGAALSLLVALCQAACNSCGSLPYGAYPLEKKIANLGTVRLTPTGLQVIAEQSKALLAKAMGGSLSFTLAADSIGNAMSTCTSPDTVVALPIDHIDILPGSPNILRINLYLTSDFSFTVPYSCSLMGGPGTECDVVANTNGIMLQISEELTLGLDNDTRQFAISFGTSSFDQNSLNLAVSSSETACTSNTSFATVTKSRIATSLNTAIQNAVTAAVENFSCLRAATDRPCPAKSPSGATITPDAKGICRNLQGVCLPASLGVEQALGVNALLPADPFPDDTDTDIWISYLAGGRTEIVNAQGENGAQVNANDLGAEIGLFGGSLLQPDTTPPSTVTQLPDPSYVLPRVPLGNTNPHSANESFDIAYALREELFDQLGYTLQNSGRLCREFTEGAANSPLGAAYIGTLTGDFKSLRFLLGKESAAVAVSMRPGTKPVDYSLLAPSTADFPSSDGIQSEIVQHFRDMNLDFMIFLHERWLRLFSVQVDIDMPYGLSVVSNGTSGESSIAITASFDTLRFSHYRVPFSILGESPEAQSDLDSGMTKAAESMIAEAMRSAAVLTIPQFTPSLLDIDADGTADLAIHIQNIVPEIPKTGGTPTEYKALVIYASIVNTATSKRKSRVAQTTTKARLAEVRLPSAAALAKGETPFVRLALSGSDADGGTQFLEYQYQVDDGPWSQWSGEANPLLQSPRWGVEGTHTIVVHARDRRHPDAYERQGQRLSVVSDHTAPTLKILRKAQQALLLAQDSVSAASELLYRWKLGAEAWSEWSSKTRIALTDEASSYPLALEAEVKDASGNVTHVAQPLTAWDTTPRRFAVRGFSAAAPRAQAAAAVEGCQQNPAGGDQALWLVLFGAFLLLWRGQSGAKMQRRRPLLPLLLLGLLLALGCNGSGKAHSIADALANALTDALGLDNGSTENGAPPKESPVANALQISQAVGSELRLGANFAFTLYSAYQADANDPVDHAIVYVKGASRYLKAFGGLVNGAFTISGTLGPDAQLQGHAFSLEFALVTKNGVVGPYKPLGVSVSEVVAQTTGKSITAVTAQGETAHDSGLPAGSTDAAAPQITTLTGPSELSAGGTFTLTLSTNYQGRRKAAGTGITGVLLTTPHNTAYKLIPATANNGLVTVTGSLASDLTLGDDLVFLLALQAGSKTGTYRAWTLKVVANAAQDGDSDDDTDTRDNDTDTDADLDSEADSETQDGDSDSEQTDGDHEISCDGCLQNELCCAYTQSCQPCPHWCEGKVCQAGYRAGACDPEEDPNPETCAAAALWSFCDASRFDAASCAWSGLGMASDASCNCVEKPRLTLGQYGRYNAVAATDSTIWFSAYNDSYGDLLLGKLALSGLSLGAEERLAAIEWTFLDGVPNAEVTNGPMGPRDGISAPGTDVGSHTSIALSSAGWPRIAYHDEDNGTLLFTYTDGVSLPDGALSWTRIVVDDGGSSGITGLYTDIWIDPQGRPVIAYMMKSDTADCTTQCTSALKLAWAKTATPMTAGDFFIHTLDSAIVGPDSVATGHLPYGTGLHPTIAALPDGRLWVFYYHHTSYGMVNDTTDNHNVGVLMRAELGGKVTDLSDPGAAVFASSEFLGSEGTLVVGDVGPFNSFDAKFISGTLYYVLAFYNATLNQLQYVYEAGDGVLRLHTADDGWRKDASNNSFQVRLGADASVQLNDLGTVRIAYQDQSRAKLLLLTESCLSGFCGSDQSISTLLGMSDALSSSGSAAEWGRSYGWYVKQKLITDGTSSVISSFSTNMSGPSPLMRLELSTP